MSQTSHEGVGCRGRSDTDILQLREKSSTYSNESQLVQLLSPLVAPSRFRVGCHTAYAALDILELLKNYTWNVCHT